MVCKVLYAIVLHTSCFRIVCRKRIAGKGYSAGLVSFQATLLMNSLTGATPTAWRVSNCQELTDCRRHSASFKAPLSFQCRVSFLNQHMSASAEHDCYILPPPFQASPRRFALDFVFLSRPWYLPPFPSPLRGLVQIGFRHVLFASRVEVDPRLPGIVLR